MAASCLFACSCILRSPNCAGARGGQKSAPPLANERGWLPVNPAGAWCRRALSFFRQVSARVPRAGADKSPTPLWAKRKRHTQAFPAIAKIAEIAAPAHARLDAQGLK